MTSRLYPAVAAGGAAVQHKETMMDDGDVKACPFCGGEGQIKWAEGGSAMNWVQCQNCGAKGPWARLGHDGSGVRNWNTRADLVASLEADLAAARAQAAVLRTSGEAMRAVVDGISGTMQHGTWRDENGARLKDTPEWVALYNALSATAAAAKRHDAEVRRIALEEVADMVRLYTDGHHELIDDLVAAIRALIDKEPDHD